jgi:hypothetical protein
MLGPNGSSCLLMFLTVFGNEIHNGFVVGKYAVVESHQHSGDIVEVGDGSVLRKLEIRQVNADIQ